MYDCIYPNEPCENRAVSGKCNLISCNKPTVELISCADIGMHRYDLSQVSDEALLAEIQRRLKKVSE